MFELFDMIEDLLGVMLYIGVCVLCGCNFWCQLMMFKDICEIYFNIQMVVVLCGDLCDIFDFGGVMWECYCGCVGNVGYIGDDEVYVVFEGVFELFIICFVLVDYMEVVNINGLLYYVKQEVGKFGKVVELEVQFNLLYFCMCFCVVIKLLVLIGKVV